MLYEVEQVLWFSKRYLFKIVSDKISTMIIQKHTEEEI